MMTHRPGLSFAIREDGWSCAYPNPPTFAPDSSPLTFSVLRQGYDSSANATTLTETHTFTKRVRYPYPDQATLTPNIVSLSDYIYSTDTVSGIQNKSTVTSPKPTANWVMPHRMTIANSINLEVVAFHRNAGQGTQVACVKFLATDGTTTVSQIVSTVTVSNRTGDQYAVLVYACTLDISTLTDNHLITANAEVYPRIGDSASIHKSADNSGAREFSPRYFLKNTTKAASPPYAYVDSAGNDGTGVWSTTAATASATPFLTVKGALVAIAGAGATGGVSDGCIIRVKAGTFVLGSSAANIPQNISAVTITRDPTVAQASAIVSFGAASWRAQIGNGGSLTSPVAEGAVIFDDISILRTGTSGIQGESGVNLYVIFNNIAFDNASYTTGMLTVAHDSYYGATISNLTGGILSSSSNGEHRCFRGLSWTAAHASIELWIVIGCNIQGVGQFTFGARTPDGSFVAFNYLNDPLVSSTMYIAGVATDINNSFIVQNVIEFCSATSGPMFAISADGAAANNSNIGMFYNTCAGFHNNGRDNVFYDEGSTSRITKLSVRKGNIHVSVNTKGDVFTGSNNGGSPLPSQARTRIGNWPFLYGVGCQDEFSQYLDAAGGGIDTSFAQSYYGLGANFGTSTTVRNDPLFTDYQGTTAGPTVGAGNGTYTVASNSPCKGMVRTGLLPYDLAGNARSTTNDTAGAYA